MRKKDFKYYINTVQLRLKAKYLKVIYSKKSHQALISQRSTEYLSKLEEVQLEFLPFHPVYNVYFYFRDTRIFDQVYDFEDSVPVSMSGSEDRNLLFPLYYGLIKWNELLSKGDNDDESLGKIADYVTNHAVLDKRGMVFPYLFDYDLFDLKGPWISGITQSLACSFFCRLSTTSNNNDYLECAEKSFLSLTLSVERDGLLCSTKKGMEWVEEYPSNPPSYVLNGHLFAIIAAIELFQLSNKSVYEMYARQWIKSLVTHLPEYQFQHYLLHNKRQDKLSNIEYQGLYVGLFKHLYELTKHPLFMEFYHFYNDNIKWEDFYRFYGIDPML